MRSHRAGKDDALSFRVVVEKLLVGKWVFFFVGDGVGEDVLEFFVGEDEVQFVPPNGEGGGHAAELETTCRFELWVY